MAAVIPNQPPPNRPASRSWMGRHPILTAAIVLFLIGSIGISIATREPDGKTSGSGGSTLQRNSPPNKPGTAAGPQFYEMTVDQHLAEARRLISTASTAEDLKNIDLHLSEALRKSPKNAEAIRLYNSATDAAKRVAGRLDQQREARAKVHPQDGLARVRCEQAVTSSLKAPSTSEFAPNSETHVLDLGKWKYRVESYVDAENSFGAHIRSPYTCTVECSAIDSCAVTELHFAR